MINLLIALGSGALSWLLFSFMVDSAWAPLAIAIPLTVGVYIYLARRTMNQAQVIMLDAQKILQKAGSKNRQPNPKQLEKVVNQAIERLKEGYELQKWQFLMKPQFDGQIGQLLYMVKKYDVSEKYLRNSFKRNWVARAMLGALLYKRKDFDAMIEVFDEATEANKKEVLLWNLYAYCLWKANKRDKAIEVLNRGLESFEKDERTQVNLKALQNNKKMKMRGWNMMWYQFHLDQPPAPRQQVRFQRR